MTRNMIKVAFTFLSLLIFSTEIYAQNDVVKDTVVQNILNSDLASSGNQGVTLMKNGDYENANKFFTSEISNDQSNSAAYFHRGVANFAMSDTLNACRDWSAVLAMGDTAMFNLLESRCHGTMIISNDTIPAKQYRKMFAAGKTSAEVNSAKAVVDEMPKFIGGDDKLIDYLSTHIRKLKSTKKGTVYVNFLIDPRGKVVYPYVAHGLGGEQDKEALRVVREMPAWKPGKLKGKALYVRGSLPIRF